MSQNYLIHFGNKNSGRYPRGSGERPHQHDGLGSIIKGHAHNLFTKQGRLDNKKNKALAEIAYATAHDNWRMSNNSKNKKFVNELLKKRNVYRLAEHNIKKAETKKEVKKILKATRNYDLRKEHYKDEINFHIKSNTEDIKKHTSNSKSKKFLNSEYTINDGDKSIEDLKGKQKEKAYEAAKQYELGWVKLYKDANKVWNKTLKELDKTYDGRELKTVYKKGMRSVPIRRGF